MENILQNIVTVVPHNTVTNLNNIMNKRTLLNIMLCKHCSLETMFLAAPTEPGC